MKVICKGKDKVYHITCSNCNSDLEYTEDDIFYTNEVQKGGLLKVVGHMFAPDEEFVNICLQEYECVRCPVCGRVNKKYSFRKETPTLGWEKV